MANMDLKYSNEFFLLKALNLIIHKDDYIFYMDFILNNEQNKMNIDINDFLIRESLINILNSNDIYFFEDLKGKSIKLSCSLLSKNINKLIIENYTSDLGNIITNVKDILDDTIDSYFKEDNYDKLFYIFNHRNGFGCRKETLEKISSKFGLTRERIRQIQMKYEKSLARILRNYKKKLSIDIKQLILTKGNYLTEEDMIDFFGYTKYAYYIEYIFSQNDNFQIFYDTNKKILYDILHFNEYKIKNDFTNKYGNTVTIEQFNKLNSFEKDIVLNYYKLELDKSVYCLKTLKYSSLILEVLDESFPHGFRVGSNDDFDYLNLQLMVKYDTKFQLLSIRQVVGMLDRFDYCLIDRGTMINRKFVPDLDNELLSKIYTFIGEQDMVVYYSTIFDEFKDDLSIYGIDNRYYLKGVIDKHLPDNFIHQRDFISIGSKLYNPCEVIMDFVNNSTGIVRIDELQKRFNNVETYVFCNYINQIGDVVWIEYNKSFILARNCENLFLYHNLIKSNIEKLFEKLNTDIISISKLYARMKLLNPQMFEDIEIFDSLFAFQSYINYLFKDEYSCVRSYISKNENLELTSSNIVLNYVRSFNRFDINIINNYIDNMHLTPLNSYLRFIEMNSDEFVQINRDELVLRQCMRINENILQDIKKIVDFYLNSYKKIDTRNYFDYSELPIINYSWNKYLLVGILRSYFKDDYDIENTDRMYNHTEFIIRKVR